MNKNVNSNKQLDDYDLINSKAIGDYCRKIKYRFNTEELAVLVYRNSKMDIKEKIAKYQDLIDNYPDMEVIERINCRHYNSVKVMIQNEIDRLKNVYENFINEDENSVYTWEEYNKSTKTYSRSYEIICNMKRTFKETYKNIQDYIKEYDDTISFTITKKYLGSEERLIYADYNVINKKPILIKIYEKEDIYLDINNIYVYMPTPFKKGDILISMNSHVDDEDIFVLEYLSTWRENIKEFLKKGNYDSSDMVGYGYYLYENKTTIMYDNKWDYDSFEYYNGNLDGNKRILKLVSNYLKDKIKSIELFINAYEYFKLDYQKSKFDYYQSEILDLLGFDDMDILKMNPKKIYTMNDEEKIEYIKCYTNGLKGISKENVEQIESDYYDNVFVLTKDKKLYKNGNLINKQIKEIYMLDGCHLYKVTSDNKIRPIDDDLKWNDIDIYLNNNDCSYKKIVISTMNIIALTKDGKVRATHSYPVCVIPENYVDVEDIKIEEIEGFDTPFVCKNGKFIKLYEN